MYALLGIPPQERNGVDVDGEYGAVGVAPHAATSRWTYTVPAGRRTLVEHLYAHALRDAAPGVSARARAIIAYTPSGGTIKALVIAELIDAAVGARSTISEGVAMWLFAGDQLEARTADDSTGGSMRYHVAFKGTEFDA